MLNNRYELLKPIGQGGFSTTYRALDHLTTRYVALKVSESSLRHEAEVLRELEYVPYISHMYDYFNDNGKECLVVRLIMGNSLAGRTKESENPITVEEMIRGLPTLVVALDQIHRHNILHRDISPGNIIMSENGAFYLIDFEAATSVRTERLKNFRVYAHKGFDAPEHLKYDLHGVPMDIYSLCATITYLLTGYGTPASENRRVSDPIPQILMSSHLSKKQQNAILRGLSVNIEDRYQNITEFAHEFLNTEISPVRMRDTQMMCYSAKTDIGRKQINQDNFSIDGIIPYIDEDCEIDGEISFGENGMHIVAISDGVSNACYAELASKAVIQAVTHFIEQYRYSRELPENLLEELLDQMNEKIISLSRKIGKTAATLALLLWKAEDYHVVSIGDSAVYRYRKRHLELLTVPHTKAEEKIWRGETVTLTDLHTLTAYLGKEGYSGWQMANYHCGKILRGDKFLICSDGISTGLTRDEIMKSMGKDGGKMIRTLWKYVKRRKIKDNCSAIFLYFD